MSHSIRLLLIEDSPGDAKLILRELERGGVAVAAHQRVDTLPELERALGEPWDIVLVDFALPFLDSLEALETVRRHDAELPIVFVSGVLGEEAAVELMRAGARDCVLKSRLGRLAPVVERELSEVRARRKQAEAEQALVQERLRFRGIFLASPVALYELDLADARHDIERLRHTDEVSSELEDASGWRALAQRMRIVAANPAAVRLLQADGASQLLGPVIHAIRPGSEAAWIEFLRAMVNERGPFEKELQIETLAGQKRDVLLVLHVPATVELRHAVVSLVDITERKSMEVQMRAAQRMEAVGRLAGGVAHDFNNVLTVIDSYTNFLLEAPQADEALRDDVRVIKDVTKRAEGLTRQLLAFSRRQIVEPQILHISQVVAELEKMLRRLLGEDIELATCLSDDIALVEIDPSHIEQILMNLAVNARDAMPRGGRLTIETANARLDAGYARGKPAHVPTGAYVMLAVSDNGAGMDQQTVQRIFEPFFTTKNRGEGTGLGLSTVYGIVKQAGGFIWAYSEPEQGTTFKVYFPQKQGRAESFKARERVKRPRGGTETVLLVEDDVHVRKGIARILKKAGYCVLLAADGMEALELSEQHEGSLYAMITDVVMPNMGGRQLAERLQLSRPELKVLYMSGYTNNAIVHHGVLEPGVAFLQKPCNSDELLLKLRSMLDSD